MLRVRSCGRPSTWDSNSSQKIYNARHDDANNICWEYILSIQTICIREIYARIHVCAWEKESEYYLCALCVYLPLHVFFAVSFYVLSDVEVYTHEHKHQICIYRRKIRRRKFRSMTYFQVVLPAQRQLECVRRTRMCASRRWASVQCVRCGGSNVIYYSARLHYYTHKGYYVCLAKSELRRAFLLHLFI